MTPELQDQAIKHLRLKDTRHAYRIGVIKKIYDQKHKNLREDQEPYKRTYATSLAALIEQMEHTDIKFHWEKVDDLVLLFIDSVPIVEYEKSFSVKKGNVHIDIHVWVDDIEDLRISAVETLVDDIRKTTIKTRLYNDGDKR